MKSKISGLLAIVSLLLSSKVMAEPQCANSESTAANQPTVQQVARNIAELENRGVIENQGGRFVLKNESALDQLRQEGRVDLVQTAYSVVCY